MGIHRFKGPRAQMLGSQVPDTMQIIELGHSKPRLFRCMDPKLDILIGS